MNVHTLTASANTSVINERREETDSESSVGSGFSEDPYDIPDVPVVVDEPDPGENLVLDFMTTKYKWKKWCNESLFQELGSSFKHGSDPVEVSPELFRLDKKVDIKDVEKRIEYLGLESKKSTRIQCEAEISSYKKRINDTIHIIVSNFMLDIARKLHFGDDKHGNGVQSWDDFLLAVEKACKRPSCKKVLIVSYLIFDWLPFYQRKVGKFVQKIHNIVIFEKERKKKSRRTQDFIYKMVSAAVNDLRKKINTASSMNTGFKYTITRYDEHLDDKKHHNDNRKKQHFYKWMVIYDPVS